MVNETKNMFLLNSWLTNDFYIEPENGLQNGLENHQDNVNNSTEDDDEDLDTKKNILTMDENAEGDRVTKKAKVA
jgi:hypothetical protein